MKVDHVFDQDGKPKRITEEKVTEEKKTEVKKETKK
jgi:hypothetical protein